MSEKNPLENSPKPAVPEDDRAFAFIEKWMERMPLALWESLRSYREGSKSREEVIAPFNEGIEAALNEIDRLKSESEGNQ